MHASTDFVLRGGDAAFTNRQKRLFEQLSIAESKCNIPDGRSAADDSNAKICDGEAVEHERDQAPSGDDTRRRRETKRFRGRESIFKRPEVPAPRATFRDVPDYHKNPHKWIKYSLSDVSNEDMTDQSNMRAALSFLREIRARKRRQAVERDDAEDESMDIDEESQAQQDRAVFRSKKRKMASSIMFKKPREATAECSEPVVVETNEKPVFKSSKIILPEYVVGERPKKICKQIKPVIKINRSTELRLDHLEQPDEEEED